MDYSNSVFYWHRSNQVKTELVAFKSNSINSDYKVDFDAGLGKFDLKIRNTSYDRDNGQFWMQNTRQMEAELNKWAALSSSLS